MPFPPRQCVQLSFDQKQTRCDNFAVYRCPLRVFRNRHLMNLFTLAKRFPTEEHALAYWMKTRWPDGVRCLACDCDKCYLIETKGKTGKAARLFECSDCELHFSATTNTLFHDSHMPLQKW